MRVFPIEQTTPILAAALMFLQHPCGAQSSNGCPVQIRHTSWKPASPGYSPYKVKGLALHLLYMNVTDEEIKEVVFEASTYYREHGAMGQSMVDNSIKSLVASTAPQGEWKKAEIDIGLSEPGRTRLRVAEVAFSSGRRWVNTTPDECEWSIAP
jgi:hypothetical protein